MTYLTFALKQNIAVVSFQTQSHFAIFYTWCAIQVKSFSAQIQSADQCAGHARFHEEIQFCALFPFLIVTTTDERSCSYPGKQQPSSS